MILEEVVLALLKTTGFDVIYGPGQDRSLRMGPSGLEILGRGGSHQADAIGDFRITMPFGYRQRLIVEAKCFSPRYPIGMPIVRNAVGVFKDINEYYLPDFSQSLLLPPRYHYRYAIFSATAFTRDAQRYAFAHDIYLVPLDGNAHMQRMIQTIRSITHRSFGAVAWNQIDLDLRELRQRVRRRLSVAQMIPPPSFPPDNPQGEFASRLAELAYEMDRIAGSLIGVANGHVLLHLVPYDRRVLRSIVELASPTGQIDVTIHYREDRGRRNWYLSPINARDARMSFDLPEELFMMYAESGILTARAALDLKEQELSQIETFYVEENVLRRLVFVLNTRWVEDVRSTIARSRE